MKLLAQLTLEQGDRQILKDKGLTDEQIAIGGYRSLTRRWHQLEQPVSDRLAGTRYGGRSLNNPTPGILCPVKDENGLYRSLRQYNPGYKELEVGKYVFLSSKGRGVTPKDKNGELPIAVRFPENYSNLNRIGICEGLEIKSLLASDRLGIPTLGFGNHNFSISPKATKKALVELAKRFATPPILTIYPDAGSVVNKAVWSDYLKAARLYKSWGYRVEFAWWGQSEKSVGDIDEIDLVTTAIAYISTDDYEAIVSQYNLPEPEELEATPVQEPSPEEYEAYLDWESEQSRVEVAIARSEFKDWLFAKAKNLSKHFRKGFSKVRHQFVIVSLPETIKYRPNNPLPTPSDYEGREPPKIRFIKGQRHQVIAKLRSLGWSKILDRSFMGLGKSHDMGRAANSEGKVFYIAADHRNPSVSTVEDNFTDLPVRHNGLVEDLLRRTPSGKPHLHWAKPGETADTASLCHQSELFLKLYNKGHVPDDFQEDSLEGTSLNPICKVCPFAGACANSTGNGYGFRYVRRLALEQRRVRTSINSLPSPEDYDYRNDIAVIDEASQVLEATKTVKADIKDVALELCNYEKYPLLHQIIKPIFNQIIPLLKGEENLPRYGLNNADLTSLLGNPPEEIKEVIEVVLSESKHLGDLIVAPDRISGWGSDWEASAKTANAYLRREAREMTEANIENLPSNFLINFLLVFSGRVPGALRINSRRQLIVTIAEDRHAEILRNMSLVVLLDATADKHFLAQKLGDNANSIIEIEEELPPLKNLTVFNVHIDGMSSNTLSPDCQSRLGKLIARIEGLPENTALIGIKKYADVFDLNGYWFADNRGSNAFKNRTAIAAFGKPQINVGAAEDEYLTLYGSLEGFDAHYQQLINAEVTQLIGRPRAHLYPNQEFVIYLIGTGHYTDHLEKLGVNVINTDAFEICQEAGTRSQISKLKMIRAIYYLVNQGKKLTMKSLAATAGISADYIKVLARDLGGMVALKKWIKVIFNSCKSHTQKFDHNFLLEQDQIRLWMDLNPVEAAKEIFQAVTDYGWRDFQLYLDNFTINIQAKMWAMLLPLILGEEESNNLQLEIFPPPF